MTTHWQRWHHDYRDPASDLSRRLQVVRRHIRTYLDGADGPVRIASACAGDGRDLLGVLETHPARDRVSGVLVELDEVLAGRAAHHAAALGVDLTVRCADAGTVDSYRDAVPADLLLMCGVFGNVTDDDVRRTVLALPRLCGADAVVIWTRHRAEPDLTGAIRAWFGEAGFDEVAFEAPEDALFGVGVHRRVRPAGSPVPTGERLFSFVTD